MNKPLLNLPVLDAHIHYGHPDLMPGLISILDANQVARCNIVCTPHTTRLSLVPDALHLKAHYPDRIFVFGGLDISSLFMAPDSCGERFAAYVDTLIAMGCDGVKMIEGKPDMRKMLPVPPFDSPVYAPYWTKMEAAGMPLVFHVNDPEEFWDAARVPDWAREQGWFYGDGSYINNEAQYAEVLHVLERHPALKVIFAHFFFLSAHLERLGSYLDRLPNMHIDLTPGIEMYHNFSQQPQKARQFFIQYQDRIVFGTDIGAKSILAAPGAGIEPAESGIRVELVRKFLELEGEFRLDTAAVSLFGKFGGAFQGLHLPVEVLEKIYHKNFEKLASARPRPLNPTAISSECARLQPIIQIMGAAQPGGSGDTSVAEKVQRYFTEKING